MDLKPAFDAAAEVIRAIPRSELLIAAILAMIGGWIGAALVRRRIGAGRLINLVSTLVLGGVLLTVVLQLSRLDPQLDLAIPELGMPEQVVDGGETRIPMAPDGHFWVRAYINGVPANFLIDTGATVSAVSPHIAEAAGLKPRAGGIPLRLSTANGTVAASISSARRLSFGNIDARGIDVVIAPGLEETNVIGMNLLSRLDSWRVERGTLVLVPPKGHAITQ